MAGSVSQGQEKRKNIGGKIEDLELLQKATRKKLIYHVVIVVGCLLIIEKHDK